MTNRVALIGWFVTFLWTSPTSAQDVPVTSLSEPEKVFSYGFANIVGIRELSDGRVILLDVGGEDVIVVIDSAWQKKRAIGREGGGPGEYRNPTKLFALPGDSSVTLDTYWRRMMVITPEDQTGGLISPVGNAGNVHGEYEGVRTSPSGIWLRPAETTDGRGNFYALGPPAALGPNGVNILVDSAPIERWTLHSQTRDTIGFVEYKLPSTASVMQSGLAHWPVPDKSNGFSSGNQWAVARDGRIASVTSNPYQVTFFSPIGERTVCYPIEYVRTRVTREHRRYWENRQVQRGTMLVNTGDGESYTTAAPPRQREIEYEWPEYLPPFLRTPLNRPKIVQFAPDGTLWVERTRAAEVPRLFDVIDTVGQVIKQVRLPENRHLAGFGNGTVYLVRVDEFDLQYLERYRMPSM